MSLRDPTTKQAGHFRPTPRGGVLFGLPLRRGSSGYHLCQVRHRRRFLMEAKNHPGAPGSQPGDYSDRLLGDRSTTICGWRNGFWPSRPPPWGANWTLYPQFMEEWPIGGLD